MNRPLPRSAGPTRSRAWVLAGLAAVGLTTASRAEDAKPPETAVGMIGRLDGVLLPGSELEARPHDDRKLPVVIQRLSAKPHGPAFRYDIEYYGLEPGAYDLRDFLRRKDGGPVADLPPLPVSVASLRPAGRVEPNKLELDRGLLAGGYRNTVMVLAVAWGLGLVVILGSFVFPRRKRVEPVPPAPPETLADRLRPLVEGAMAGNLSPTELAGLERALLALWRKRLGLEFAPPAAAFEALRTRPEVGPLLSQLEVWLHKPGVAEPIDVPALLAPYRDLPPDAADLSDALPREAVTA